MKFRQHFQQYVVNLSKLKQLVGCRISDTKFVDSSIILMYAVGTDQDLHSNVYYSLLREKIRYNENSERN